MNKRTFSILSALLLLASSIQAQEKYNHFASLEAKDTQAALCNLAAFNETLKAITAKEALTPEDMVKVHELTYTLENAVIRLQQDLNTIAEDLESVHLASERLDADTVKSSGQTYLTATELLLNRQSCR
ncbi:DUF6746 family protein [Thalassotalea litorea]|uniref:DUF6746 family protein n=1 Tax=Thalassotalea litorea TaxID=2020715 RepID=UPI00373599AE